MFEDDVPITGLKIFCNLDTYVGAACLSAGRIKYSCSCARPEGVWEVEVQFHSFLTLETNGQLQASAALPWYPWNITVKIICERNSALPLLIQSSLKKLRRIIALYS